MTEDSFLGLIIVDREQQFSLQAAVDESSEQYHGIKWSANFLRPLGRVSQRLLKDQRLEEALIAVGDLMAHFPRWAAGYLFAGDIWIQRLSYKNASTFYQQGLHMIDDQSSVYNEPNVLKERDNHTITQRERKIDPCP